MSRSESRCVGGPGPRSGNRRVLGFGTRRVFRLGRLGNRRVFRAGDRAQGRPGRSSRWGGTDGFVTAEAAVALPVLVLLTAVLVAGIGAAAAQIRCVDAAQAGARALARGEPGAVVAARV